MTFLVLKYKLLVYTISFIIQVYSYTQSIEKNLPYFNVVNVKNSLKWVIFLALIFYYLFCQCGDWLTVGSGSKNLSMKLILAADDHSVC